MNKPVSVLISTQVLHMFFTLNTAQVSVMVLPGFLDPFSSVAVFVHTTVAGAAVTLGWLEVALLCTTRNIGA